MCLNIQQIYCYYILKDGIMQFSSAIVDFYLFSDGSVDMQIWTLLTRRKCGVSETRVTLTLRPLGLLFNYQTKYFSDKNFC